MLLKIIFIAATALLIVGFMATFARLPLAAIFGDLSRPAAIAETVQKFCARHAIWTAGLIAILMLLHWLHGESLLLWSIASLVIGTTFLAYLATVLIMAFGACVLGATAKTKTSKATLMGGGLVAIVIGVAMFWQSVRLFFMPVYSAIV